ncbi:MAG: hypothetical protein PUH24_03540 [Prevotellaceae bacterium]|nr:hypothetical protein [Prevotella sp.]MDD7257338.1 hypothetical protein [Prevotellaceae bacterium]MDY6131073.1 hypothetical protein [Prevotella sp.]
MTCLIVSLIALGVVAALIGVLQHNKKDGTDVIEKGVSSCATCTGTSEQCGQECMMEAAVKEIEYYDDEDLDIFRGKPSDTYNDDEAEQFREILYTMKQEEVSGWVRSLTLRGVSLPNQVKDEVFVLVSP